MVKKLTRRRAPPHWEAIRQMAELRKRRLLGPIAKACGVQYQSVWRWDVVPLHHVVAVEAVTGVPRERLRPDFHRTSALVSADAPPFILTAADAAE